MYIALCDLADWFMYKSLLTCVCMYLFVSEFVVVLIHVVSTSVLRSFAYVVIKFLVCSLDYVFSNVI